MKQIFLTHAPSLAHTVDDSTHLHFDGLIGSRKFALAVAMGATLASLSIAMYAGWQSGSLLIERLMRMALVGIAVLVVHWLPLAWSTFRRISQVCAFALWIVATAVVLFGQATFFMNSQRHAGDLRAATIPEPAVPTNIALHPGRSRAEIARESAKVSADLARAQGQPCAGDCLTLKVRQVRLASEIAALGVEADEAKRREVEEDRRNERADRSEALRAALRADPVAFSVASWLGTTERRLELIIGFASAVALEGAAILGWTFVAVFLGRDAGRSVTVPDYAHGTPESDPAAEVESGRTVMSDCNLAKPDRTGSRETIASSHEATAREREGLAPGRTSTVGESAGSLVTSEDNLLLKKIHEAVVAEQLKPTQEALRKFLRCGQLKAGSLARQYRARFGGMRGQDGRIENIREALLDGAVFRVSPDMAHMQKGG
ncbi:hypothetical protein ACO0LO_15665 [Undibacterium sp. TJN25]|uniref:hypothetical protein n=1 Tax=Undibacterium sp. TJN25 TaxID=3413056 RepID=UPI003BF3D110